MKKILFFSSVLFFLPKIFFGAVCSDQNLQTYLSQKKIDLKNDVLDSNFEIQLAPYLF